MHATLADTLSRQLFHWAVTQSDLWYIATRCATLVNKIHEPLERGVAALDHLLTLEEEETLTVNESTLMDFIDENRENIVNNINNNSNNDFRYRGKNKLEFEIR